MKPNTKSLLLSVLMLSTVGELRTKANIFNSYISEMSPRVVGATAVGSEGIDINILGLNPEFITDWKMIYSSFLFLGAIALNVIVGHFLGK